jgi:hypothetical protein
MNVENMLIVSLTIHHDYYGLVVSDTDERGENIEREFELDALDASDLLTRALQIFGMGEIPLHIAIQRAIKADPAFLDNAVEQP